jgi:hypothetical protein
VTQLHERRFVACPFSAALEFAESAVNRRSGLFLSPAPPLGEHADVAVASTPDSSDDVRKHDALLIAWRPQRTRFFPDFHGVLTVRPEHAGVTLQLDGVYEPPYGALGKAFDLLGGRSIARHTMQNLLRDLGADIEAEYRQERSRAAT